MNRWNFERIYLDTVVENTPLARRILGNLPGVPCAKVEDSTKFLENSKGISPALAKRRLWITRFKGPLVKRCPGTERSYLCCRYYVINSQLNCPMECSYCVLQNYLDSPFLTIYTNLDAAEREMENLMLSQPGRLFRIGTGELTDSLALDPLTGTGRELIDWCRGRKMILELKTKTDFVEHLPPSPGGNAVVSWSLNPEEVIREEEFGAASLEARLKAAGAAHLNGYRIGFHFDPILHVQDWEKKYRALIQRLQSAVPEEAVMWISLGSFRFPPALKKALHRRFPRTAIASGELVPGLDGKKRYFRPLRTKMYRSIYSQIRERWEKVFVYFCMENKTVWEEVTGFSPRSNEHLDYLFHESIFRRFPDLSLCKPEERGYETSESL